MLKRAALRLFKDEKELRRTGKTVNLAHFFVGAGDLERHRRSSWLTKGAGRRVKEKEREAEGEWGEAVADSFEKGSSRDPPGAIRGLIREEMEERRIVKGKLREKNRKLFVYRRIGRCLEKTRGGRDS